LGVAGFDAEIHRFAQDDNDVALYVEDGITPRHEKTRTMSRCGNDLGARCFVTVAQAEAYATEAYPLTQLFQGVIGAEMWYFFSFEQRPASQLAVPLGGTQ
jgi:hypothetical protein